METSCKVERNAKLYFRSDEKSKRREVFPRKLLRGSKSLRDDPFWRTLVKTKANFQSHILIHFFLGLSLYFNGM
jgi:hypothetical protein